MRSCTFSECLRPHMARGLCQYHYNRERRPSVTAPRLPAEPLLEYIAGAGGVGAQVPGLSVPALDGEAGSGVVVRTAAELELIRWARVRLANAKVRGFISAYTADEVCINLLGVHPCMVWGEAWWLPVAADELEDAA